MRSEITEIIRDGKKIGFACKESDSNLPGCEIVVVGQMDITESMRKIELKSEFPYIIDPKGN